MLRSLGSSEVEQILAEQGRVEVTCEFCGQRYTFTPEQCHAFFSGVDSAD
jgi:molecular chaperone Hsp33